MLDVPRPGAGAGADSEPMHLLVDSTGLKRCGKDEWLLEKHGTATRRSWRMLHGDGFTVLPADRFERVGLLAMVVCRSAASARRHIVRMSRRGFRTAYIAL